MKLLMVGLMMLVIILRIGVVLESPVERISLLRMQVGMNKQISGQ